MSIRFDQASLTKVLQDDIHGLARETHQVSQVGLVESNRNQDPGIVTHPIIGREVGERVRDARGHALVEELLTRVRNRRKRYPISFVIW